MANSTAIPGLHYRDANAAIEWLCNVLGFEKQLVVPGPDDTVMHAQLTFPGGGMIMLGSGVGSHVSPYMVRPDQIGGRETQYTYLVVPDADAVYRRAKAAGAEILIDIKDQPYGGRDFTCRDPQGHIWAVGTYDPWREMT